MYNVYSVYNVSVLFEHFKWFPYSLHIAMVSKDLLISMK